MSDATPITADAGDHTYKFNVAMSCGGCSGAVDRVLKRLDGQSPPAHFPNPNPHTNTPGTIPGVKSYTVSLETQTATVIASEGLDYDKVLRTIAKTGKKVISGEADGGVRGVEVKDL